MKRSVIIGLGSISVVHTAALVNNDFAKIAAICDIDPQKIEATKKAIPYPVEAFTDYNDINEDTRMQLELINETLAELQTQRKPSGSRRAIGFKKE